LLCTIDTSETPTTGGHKGPHPFPRHPRPYPTFLPLKTPAGTSPPSPPYDRAYEVSPVSIFFGRVGWEKDC